MSMPPARLVSIVKQSLSDVVAANPAICLPLDETAAWQELVQLARHNFKSGRYDRFRNHPRAPARLTPQRYVQHLVATWARESDFYYRLCAQDAACWSELRQALIHAVTGPLGRFPSSDTAEDYVQRACAQILLADYPFDVPFLWWATTIAQNLVSARGRSKDRFNDYVISLDTPLHSEARTESLVSQLPDPLGEFFIEAIHERELLYRALRRLNEQRRLVIVLSYFDEWDDTMIGDALGIKPANVQTLRHRALDQLAEFLGENSVTVKRRRRHRIDKRSSGRRKKHEARHKNKK